MKILDRYSSAINSSNLKSRAETTWSDTDCLAAMGIAGRQHPLGAALQRLFVDGKVSQCVSLLAEMARIRSHKIEQRMSDAAAGVVAQKVLAWYRHGVCQDCSGTGKMVMLEPKPHLSEDDCPSCYGTGRRPFESGFSAAEIDIALWLQAEINRQQARAGQAAMQAIAPMLDL